MRVSHLMTRDVLHALRETSLDEAMERMDSADIRHLPVVQNDRVVGVLSERDLLEATGWLPPRLREVLHAPKGRVEDFMHSPVVSVSPEDSIVTASLRLIDWNIGCLPVLNDGALVGLLSDGDVMTAYVSACSDLSIPVDFDPFVEDVMTREVVFADHRMTADEALEFCREKNIRHLPLMKGEELAGIISDRDLRVLIGRGQLEGTPIGELAPRKLTTVEPGIRLSRVAERLVQDRIGALPVVDGGKLVGLISTTDVLKHCAIAFAD